MSIKAPKRLSCPIRFPEQLEVRNMLSGHALGFAFSARSAMNATTAFVQQAGHYTAATSASSQLAARNQIFSAFGSSYSASQQTVLTATLSDPNNSAASGTLTYETGSLFGVSVTLLKVSVTGAAASSTLDVTIGGTGGTVVGQIATDTSGAGTLVLSSNPSSSQLPLPSNFPTSITAGTAVSVDTLSGTLAASTQSGGGCSHGGGSHDEGDSARTILTAGLTDSTNSAATGTIS
jgi:hypothetical protein